MCQVLNNFHTCILVIFSLAFVGFHVAGSSVWKETLLLLRSKKGESNIPNQSNKTKIFGNVPWFYPKYSKKMKYKPLLRRCLLTE